MKVSNTAWPLYCERRTSSPRESRSTKSAAGAGGFNSAGAWSFAVAPAALVARVEVVFDEPPQAVSSAAVALVAMMNARCRGARFLFVRAALRYGDSRASNRVPARVGTGHRKWQTRERAKNEHSCRRRSHVNRDSRLGRCGRNQQVHIRR